MVYMSELKKSQGYLGQHFLSRSCPDEGNTPNINESNVKKKKNKGTVILYTAFCYLYN